MSAGTSVALTVRFKPQTTRPPVIQSALVVQGQYGALSIPLTAAVAQADITVASPPPAPAAAPDAPPLLDTGVVVRGETANHTIVLRNDGAAPVRVAVSLLHDGDPSSAGASEGDGGAGVFSLALPALSGIPLPGHSTLRIPVTTAPPEGAAIGQHSATVTASFTIDTEGALAQSPTVSYPTVVDDSDPRLRHGAGASVGATVNAVRSLPWHDNVSTPPPVSVRVCTLVADLPLYLQPPSLIDFDTCVAGKVSPTARMGAEVVVVVRRGVVPCVRRGGMRRV
jgi:hypothetical protein